MFANFIEETCTGTTGAVTLTGATEGNIPFTAKYVDADPVSYVIEDGNGVNKCGGVGTYNTDGTITRADTWTWNGITYNDSPSGNLTLSSEVHTLRVTPITSDLNRWDSKNAWSDQLNSHIIPDTNRAYSIGNIAKEINLIYARYLILSENISVGGTVNGRDIAADGDKLDTIESGATENHSNTYLLNRANHTRKQSIATIEEVDWSEPNTHGYTLTWNNSTKKFGAVPLPFMYLGGVNVSTASTGDRLIYSGGTWVNGSVGNFAHYTTSSTDTIPNNPTKLTVIFDNPMYEDLPFDSNSSEVTVNRTAWYRITYSGSAYNSQTTNNNRLTVRWSLEHYSGSIWIEVPGSASYSYHRNSADGEGSGQAEVMISLNAGDKIRVRAMANSSQPDGDLTLVPDGCSLTLEKVTV